MVESLLIGIVSAVTGAFIVVGLSALFSRRLRWLVALILGRIIGIDIERVYPSQTAASSLLRDELRKARWVKFMAGRGNELTRKTCMALWDTENGRLRSVQILLPDPELSGPGSWLADREAEASRHDKGYGRGLIADQTRANIRFIMEHGRESVTLRLFDFPHLARIVATDRVVFFTPYSDAEHGSDGVCIVFRGPGTLYDFWVRLFDKVWAFSRQVSRLPGDIV
jgi:hypothetical protein